MTLENGPMIIPNVNVSVNAEADANDKKGKKSITPPEIPDFSVLISNKIKTRQFSSWFPSGVLCQQIIQF